jgi:hypothetical protein
MATEVSASSPDTDFIMFPRGLLDWSGSRSGGVRRLFDNKSGRPGGEVIETPLIQRLRDWARSLGGQRDDTPNTIFLVGGPGNGKTEAIERTIEELDWALGCDHRLVERLTSAFNPATSKVPRKVTLDLSTLLTEPRKLTLDVVQDATVESGGTPAGQLLVSELGSICVGGSDSIYLCCVNRGVLDDALIHAIETGDENARKLLETIVRVVSLAPDAPPCWPLSGFPNVAVWPMDAETLVDRARPEDQTPGTSILRCATDQAGWPEAGKCAAGSFCPFCTSLDFHGSESP